MRRNNNQTGDTVADHMIHPSPHEKRKQVHKGLVLHFMTQLCIVADSDAPLATLEMGRVHHRILYFAHFTPGITVGELLSVLGVRHQNIQPALRRLVQEGYIRTRPSKLDGRIKELYCSRKGDKLLEFASGPQRARFERAYDSVTEKDVESYFKVMTAMLDPDRRDWVRRLTELDKPGESV